MQIAATENLELPHMDVKTAILNGDCNEEIFMDQPGGFVDYDFPEHLCKLFKAMYGLEQAPGQWFAKTTAFL